MQTIFINDIRNALNSYLNLLERILIVEKTLIFAEPCTKAVEKPFYTCGTTLFLFTMSQIKI